MIIIGMTGPISHGKTTFADAIEKIEPSTIHFESSLIIAEVINALHASTDKIPSPYDVDSINEWLKPLPSILLEVLGVKCNIEQIRISQSDADKHPIEYDKLMLHIEGLQRDPSLISKAIDSDNKESFRAILQWVGGYLVKKVSSDIWYDEIIKRAHKAEQDGFNVCIIGGLRFPSDAKIVHQAGGIIIKVYRPDHLQYDILDPTERERDNIACDSTIMSNGTIEDMNLCAVQVLDDIKNEKLEKIYQTIRYRVNQ
ncbi:MAG: hypothetical protein WCJ86_02765 [Candidatus Saccharibacteria bacterium]